MKNESGITLVVLAITVVVLAILASSVAIVSVSTIDYTKENKFIAEMKLIRERVNIVNKEVALGSMAYSSIGRNISTLSSDEKASVQTAFSGAGVNSSEQANYKYFNMQDLKSLGIYDIEQRVLIDFTNLNVISVDGITVNNVTYYTIEAVEAIM